MSRLGGNPAYHVEDNVFTVSGRILGGSGVASIKAGKGFALTYVSTGLYQITPDVNFAGIAGGAAVLMSASNNYAVRVKAYVVNTGSGAACYVQFLVTSSGSATDLGSSDELWFTLDFERTTKP